MFLGTLGVTERQVCVFPASWYPPESACSLKHNVEQEWVVETTSEQRKWWEVEEKQKQQKESQVAWSDMMAPLRIGAVVIVGAVALGIALSITQARKPLKMQMVKA